MNALIDIGVLTAIQARGQAIAEQAMKHDESIACRNATVLIDSRGNISWLNNACPPVVLGGEIDATT